MAFLKYRQSTTATVPGSTTAKGTPLTNLEMDGNFKSISDALDNITTDLTVVDDNTTNAVVFPMWATAAGYHPARISTTKIRYNPSTDTLTCAQFAGNAATVTTNANLTGMVTSVGNATTVVTNANLNGMVTSAGNTTTVVTNAALTGEATSNGVTNAVTLTNSAVIGKLLTGYTKGAGTVAAGDSILAAIQKLAGNDDTNANLTGMVTSVGNATTVVTNAALFGEATSDGTTNAVTLSNSAVIGKQLTGFTSGTGTVTATDTILSAIQKLYGNLGTLAPITNAVLVTPTISALAAQDTNTLGLASMQWTLAQLSTTNPLGFGAAAYGSSLRMAREDHVHPDIRPAARAGLNGADQVLTSGAATSTVELNLVTFDSVGSTYNTTNHRWTPGTIGYYSLNGACKVTGAALSSVTIELYKNTTLVSTRTVTGTSLSVASIGIDDIVKTTATGDYFEMRIAAVGTSPVVNATPEATYFSGSLISKG